MRRKAMAAALAATTFFGLAACGGGGGRRFLHPTPPRSTGIGPITLVQGKDTSGFVQGVLDDWNKAHPDEKARLIELPTDADSQRQKMIQNAQTKSDAYDVLLHRRGLDLGVRGQPRDRPAARERVPSSTRC